MLQYDPSSLTNVCLEFRVIAIYVGIDTRKITLLSDFQLLVIPVEFENILLMAEILHQQRAAVYPVVL